MINKKEFDIDQADPNHPILFFGHDFGPKSTRLAELARRIDQDDSLKIAGGQAFGADQNTTQILELLCTITPGHPYVVRSSAPIEDAGTGIYSSEFVVPSGARLEDEELFRQAVNKVRSSETEGEKGAQGQMGVLIQPVVCDRYTDFFAPTLSGVLTTFKGIPVLRVAMGLGTMAVGEKGITIPNPQRLTLDEFIRILHEQTVTHVIKAIPTQQAVIDEIAITPEQINAAQRAFDKLMSLVRSWVGLTHQAEYWEFAIAESHAKPVVVQTHPETRFSDALVPENLPIPEGKVLAEGSDTVLYGSASGTEIVVLSRSISGSDLQTLKEINRQLRGYALVVPQSMLSGLTTDVFRQLRYAYFSNASIVIEDQLAREKSQTPFTAPAADHTGGRGGSHFAGLLQNRNILFLGAEDIDVLGFLGRPTQEIGHSIAIYSVRWQARVVKNGGRIEVFGDALQLSVSLHQLSSWVDIFRVMAKNQFLDEIPEEVCDALHGVLNLIASDSRNTAQLMLFQWKPTSEYSISDMIRNIKTVLDNMMLVRQSMNSADDDLSYTDLADEQEVAPMIQYLQQYLKILTQLNEEEGVDFTTN